MTWSSSLSRQYSFCSWDSAHGSRVVTFGVGAATALVVVRPATSGDGLRRVSIGLQLREARVHAQGQLRRASHWAWIWSERSSSFWSWLFTSVRKWPCVV